MGRLADLIRKHILKIKVMARLQERKFINLKSDRDFNQVVAILTKGPRFRFSKDIDILQSALASLPFFRDSISIIGVNLMRQFLKELQYEKFVRRETVYSNGDIGQKIYFILRGEAYAIGHPETDLSDLTVVLRRDTVTNLLKASLSKRHNLKAKQQRLDMSQGDIDSSMMTPFLTALQDDSEYLKSISDDYFINIKYPGQSILTNLDAFGMFGEGCLNNRIVRQITIMAKNGDLHLASLTREAFNKIINQLYNQTMEDNLEFLRQVDIFNGWSQTNLTTIYPFMEQKQYTYGQIIYKENDVAEEVYFIKNGTVEITQLMFLQTRKLNPTERLIKPFINNPDKFNSRQKRFRLAQLSSHQTFGQDEILMNINRLTMAMCTSEKLCVIALKRNRFIQLCMKGDQQKRIEQNTFSKEQWRLSIAQFPANDSFLTQDLVSPQSIISDLQKQAETVPLPRASQAKSQLDTFRMRYMKPIGVGKISSTNNQIDELNRVNEVMHTSKFHENTEHKQHLQENFLLPVDQKYLVVEQGKNILMEKRLRDVQEKFTIKPRHYRKISQDLAKFKQFTSRKPVHSMDIVRRNQLNYSEFN